MVSFFKEGLERNFVGILVYCQGIFKQMPSAKIARIAEGFDRFSYLRRRRENIRNKTGRKAVFVSLQHAVRVQCPSDMKPLKIRIAGVIAQRRSKLLRERERTQICDSKN